MTEQAAVGEFEAAADGCSPPRSFSVEQQGAESLAERALPIPDATPAAEPACPVGAGRMTELDVMRGIAALIVVLYHYGCYFTRKDSAGSSKKSMDMLPTGELAVVLFFMISGRVLGIAFLKRGNLEDLLSAVVRRIPRLALPLLVASLLSYQLAIMGAYRDQAPATGAAFSVFGPTQMYTKSLFESLGMVQILFNGKKNLPFPSGVIWTLRVELLGSIYVYAIVWPLRRLAQSNILRCGALHAFLLILLISLSSRINGVFIQREEAGYPCVFGNYIFDFEVGLAWGHLQLVRATDARELLPERLAWLRHPNLTTLKHVLAPVLILGSFVTCTKGVEPLLGKPPAWWLSSYDGTRWYWSAPWDHVLSILILLGLAWAPPQALQYIRKLKWLGDISLGLYLTHALVLQSLGCWAFLKIWGVTKSQTAAFWGSFIISIAPTLLVAHLFWKWVDEPLGVRLPRRAWTEFREGYRQGFPSLRTELREGFPRLRARFFGGDRRHTTELLSAA